MSTVHLMNHIVEIDATFTLQEHEWIGKCLICNGPLRFEDNTEESANIEHIQMCSLSSTNDLRKLGITRRQYNGEMGCRWDDYQHRHAKSDRFQTLIIRLRTERMRRWRNPTHLWMGLYVEATLS